MWCLVSQPNSHIVEVEVDQKAKGQEVLEKVHLLYNFLFINNLILQFNKLKTIIVNQF